DCGQPLNVGSDEMVTINQLVRAVAEIAGKRIECRHIAGPLGVRGRNSDNRLIKQKLGWRPSAPLRSGLERTYEWIERQVRGAPGAGAVARGPGAAAAQTVPAQSHEPDHVGAERRGAAVA
ncbi:MAG TPA: hypothetical protein VNT59_00005, partial [Ramlibacter sp.]|nr:hypothetical protein [Ramlibacter sp.]